jgi:hypothetical protein
LLLKDPRYSVFFSEQALFFLFPISFTGIGHKACPYQDALWGTQAFVSFREVISAMILSLVRRLCRTGFTTKTPSKTPSHQGGGEEEGTAPP